MTGSRKHSNLSSADNILGALNEEINKELRSWNNFIVRRSTSDVQRGREEKKKKRKRRKDRPRLQRNVTLTWLPWIMLCLFLPL